MASPKRKSVSFSHFLAACLVSCASVAALNATSAPAAAPVGMHASVTQVFVNCTSETFACVSDQKCLPKTYKCDGIGHCADKSDETGCSKYECDLKEFFQCKFSDVLLGMYFSRLPRKFKQVVYALHRLNSSCFRRRQRGVLSSQLEVRRTGEGARLESPGNRGG